MMVGGSWGDSIKKMIAEPFAAENGVTMAYDQRPNAQQIASLVAMRGNPTVDCVEVGGPRLGQALALDLFEELDTGIVTHFDSILPSFRNSRFAGRIQVPMALTFNTKYVDVAAAAEKGWDVMLDPKLKGRVAIPNFGWQGEMWMNAINLARGGSYDNLDPAIEFCRKVVKDNDGLVMGSNDQGMKMFTTQEVWAAPFWTGRTYQLQDKGVPLEFTYPPGWVSYYTGFGVVKGTPKRDLAMRMVNKSLEPAVQEQMAAHFSYPPTHRAALSKVEGNARLEIPAAAWERHSDLEYDQMYKFADKNLERWNKEVLG